MAYITSEIIAFYVTLSINVCYAALFVYHFIKSDTNRSLKILAGTLCLSMACLHVLTGYQNALDKASMVYYNLVVNWYVIQVGVNGVLLAVIYGLHRGLKVPFVHTVDYVFRGIALSIILNVMVHIDVRVLGNRDSDWLYTLYSVGENLIVVFVFFSVLIARKWSEVLKWLQSAHSQ